MIKRTASEIEKMISSNKNENDQNDVFVQGVSTDSRNICPSNLFIPLVGEHFDGHDFIQQAIEKGAVATLWQKDHTDIPVGIYIIYVADTLLALQELAAAYRIQLKTRIIGITGSNGKTTTKDLLSSVLETTYSVVKTEGNLNNHIGLPLTLLKMAENTEMTVLEMGMSARGEIALLSGIAKPEVVIITNVGEAHLLQLGSREEIAKAKLEICSGLKQNGLLIYHGDEPLLEKFIESLKKHRNEWGFQLHSDTKMLRFGWDPNNDLYATAIMSDGAGYHFTINSKQSATFYISLLGKHNVLNTLSVIAASKYMGINNKRIRKALRHATITGMRTEVLKGFNGVTIINDCYNSSPTSMKAAIETLKDLSGYNTKILVIGDMLELGEEAERFHSQIGELLHPDKIDYVFTYGELANYIAKAAAPIFAAGRVNTMQDKSEIAKNIMRITNSNDVVFIKGSRGMKLEELAERLMQGNFD